MASTGKLKVLAVLLGLLFVTGCAFGDRNVLLSYPPEESTDNSLISAAAAAEPAAVAEKPIVLLQFDDLRTDTAIGEVRNGLGLHTADVIAVNNVAVWVTDAIRKELMNAGFRVIERDTEGAALETVALSGDVLSVFCTAFIAYEAEVSLRVRVEKNGQELLNKGFAGKGSVGLNWAATGKSYGQSLSLALADAVRRMVADVRGLTL